MWMRFLLSSWMRPVTHAELSWTMKLGSMSTLPLQAAISVEMERSITWSDIYRFTRFITLSMIWSRRDFGSLIWPPF